MRRIVMFLTAMMFVAAVQAYDVVIVGGTPGGIMTAVAAAREGKRSVLLERTSHVGGLPANGLGATDIYTRGATTGLFHEFTQRVKSYYIDKFGKENFEQYLYFNLEKNDEVRNIFEKTIDEEKILQELELYIGKKIDLDKTLLFFDEIQVSENFIVSLKYFNESEKPYKIVCAGSLLRSKNK